jgi:PhnB protein
MPIVTTLNFCGRTEQALRFYAEALGAETLFLMRFSEGPNCAHLEPGTEHLIFHATFRIEGTEFIASDVGYAQGRPPEVISGFSLAMKLTSAEKAERIFAALAAHGRIVVPLSAAAFTTMYGIVVDQFGVSWKINVDAQSG